MNFRTDDIKQAIDFFVECGDCEILCNQPDLSHPDSPTLPSLIHVLASLDGAPSMRHALTGEFQASPTPKDNDELKAIDEGWYWLMELTANSSCTLYPAAYALFTDNRLGRLAKLVNDPYVLLFHIAKTLDVIYYDEFHLKAAQAMSAWTGTAFTWEHGSHINRCKDLADTLFGSHWWELTDAEFGIRAGISLADMIWHERPPIRPELISNSAVPHPALPDGLDNIAP